MSDDDHEFRTFADMMAKVGTFMFYWSSLEIALAEKLHEAGLSLNGSIEDRLKRWMILHATNRDFAPDLLSEIVEQTLEIKKVRNLIVHGLHAAHSDPEGERPYIACRAGGHAMVTCSEEKLTYEQLEHLIQSADSCRRAFEFPANHNYSYHNNIE